MDKQTLSLDKLEVSTFVATPDALAPVSGAAEPNLDAQYAIARDCTGCMSGCGIMGPY